jgi:hypothetical protein
MDPRLEQLRPETIDRLAKKAQAEGLSLDAYLNVLLGLLNEGTALAEMSEAEFEAFIEDLSKGSEHCRPCRQISPVLTSTPTTTRCPTSSTRISFCA